MRECFAFSGMRARVIQLDVLISAQAVLRALAGMPAFVIELKPLWLYAWRAQLAAEGFGRASFADLDVVFGDLAPWVAAGSGYDVATWGFRESARRRGTIPGRDRRARGPQARSPRASTVGASS